MEVVKKPVLPASQKPPRIKSHVVPSPTDRDRPDKGTFFGCCRIDLKEKDCKSGQRQLDARQNYTCRGKQRSCADNVKFVTKVLIKKKSPRVQSNCEHVLNDVKDCRNVENDKFPERLNKTLHLSARKLDELSSKDELQTDTIYSNHDQPSSNDFSCAQDKTGQTSLLYQHDKRLCVKISKTGLTGKTGPEKTKQTSFLPGSSHHPVKNEMATLKCAVCVAEKIGQSLMNEPRDTETGKTDFPETTVDGSGNDMTSQTSLLSKRLCSSPRGNLASASVADKIGRTDLSSSSSFSRHELYDDVTTSQIGVSSTSKFSDVEDPYCFSNESVLARSNCPLCLMEQLDILRFTDRKTSQTCFTSRRTNTCINEPDCKASQTCFPYKRSVHLPSVSLLDSFPANVRNDHVQNGHFPNRRQTPDIQEETVPVNRSAKVQSEVEINHLVRSLSERLTANKPRVKHCRPTLFAAPTIGEINLLLEGPGKERKNSQRERAWSVPSVSRLHTIEAMLGQPKCNTVNYSSYDQETEVCDTGRLIYSRCSAPSCTPY